MTYPPFRIGLIGYSRTGKDAFADAIVSLTGASKVSQGEYIKRLFAPMLALDQTVYELADQFKTEIDTDALYHMYFHHGCEVIDFARAEGGIDAFTQVDAVKDRIRPLLEHGGYVMLPVVNRLLEADLASFTGPVINSRLFDVPQCQQWRDLGGVIWECHRTDVGPKTEYEDKNMLAVRAAGLIDRNLHNDKGLADWIQLAEMLALDESARHHLKQLASA